jgi:predicted cobalt transporter CbtA
MTGTTGEGDPPADPRDSAPWLHQTFIERTGQKAKLVTGNVLLGIGFCLMVASCFTPHPSDELPKALGAGVGVAGIVHQFLQIRCPRCRNRIA